MTHKQGVILLFVSLIALVVFSVKIVRGRNSNPNPSAKDPGAEANESKGEEANRSIIAESKINDDLLNQSGWDNTVRVRSLLRAGADVNVKDTNGDTPLIIAAFHGSSETVRILLEQGADLNAKNNLGNTALMEAAGMNRAETVMLLLAKGVDANAKNIIGLTAMDVAQGKDYQNIIRLLKTAGLLKTVGRTASESINPYTGNLKNDLDLQHAAMEGNVEKLRSLLAMGADVNVRGKTGSTALMTAAQRGNTAAVQFLLANKANPNLVDLKDGRTALIIATMQGHTDIVRALLNGGADANKKDKSGDSAMSIVQRTGQSQVGRLLKQSGVRTPSYNQVLTDGKP